MKPLSIAALATALCTAAAVLVLWVMPVSRHAVDTVQEIIPQITSWWDSGEVYKITRETIDKVDLVVPEWPRKVGAISVIAIAAVFVYKKKIKPPEKKGE
jgi:hypothetical protein